MLSVAVPWELIIGLLLVGAVYVAVFVWYRVNMTALFLTVEMQQAALAGENQASCVGGGRCTCDECTGGSSTDGPQCRPLGFSRKRKVGGVT